MLEREDATSSEQQPSPSPGSWDKGGLLVGFTALVGRELREVEAKYFPPTKPSLTSSFLQATREWCFDFEQQKQRPPKSISFDSHPNIIFAVSKSTDFGIIHGFTEISFI